MANPPSSEFSRPRLFPPALPVPPKPLKASMALIQPASATVVLDPPWFEMFQYAVICLTMVPCIWICFFWKKRFSCLTLASWPSLIVAMFDWKRCTNFCNPISVVLNTPRAGPKMDRSNATPWFLRWCLVLAGGILQPSIWFDSVSRVAWMRLMTFLEIHRPFLGRPILTHRTSHDTLTATWPSCEWEDRQICNWHGQRPTSLGIRIMFAKQLQPHKWRKLPMTHQDMCGLIIALLTLLLTV